MLKTQFEARSRYEQANDRKIVENVLDSYPLGRVKARTELVSERRGGEGARVGDIST